MKSYDLEYKTHYTSNYTLEKFDTFKVTDVIYVYNENSSGVYKRIVCGFDDSDFARRVNDCLNACKDISDPLSVRDLILFNKEIINSISSKQYDLEMIIDDVGCLLGGSVNDLNDSIDSLKSSLRLFKDSLGKLRAEIKNNIEKFDNVRD